MSLKGLLVEDLNKDTLLSAGAADVNITDWFFFKDKITLKYIGLTDAVVNMNRTDSVWNYQYLIDYFDSGTKKTSSGKKQLNLDIKILQFKNIRFNQKDKWIGNDITVSFKKLDLFADDINLNTKIIQLNTINLDAPFFSQSDYTGNRPPKEKSAAVETVAENKTPPAFQWNNDGWVLKVANIKITNGGIKIDKETDRPAYTDQFDGLHLFFGKINGELKNTVFEKDTLTSDINLTTKEQCGFEVTRLNAQMKFSPKMMEFNNLDLQTPNSKLSNYYVMRFDDFEYDMNRFLHNVTLEGNFINSELNSKDLAYFAPELASWKRTFYLNGKAKGTIDNLSAKQINIKSGNTAIDGEIALRGLPDIDNTFIDLKANNLQTTYADLISIIPALKNITQPKLSKLGNIRYKGNFTGFISDFVAFGTIQTNLGTVTADVNMKLPAGKPALYTGNIATSGFKLGEFINYNDLGAITFNGKVNGSSFNPEDVKINFDGDIKNIRFMGNSYQNIVVKGDFKNKIFNGRAGINDPNLKVNNLTGIIDLSGKEPEFNFDAELEKASLKKLGLTSEDFDVKGHFNLNFTGSNIDNFLGTAKIFNASLIHNNKPLAFDSLILQSQLTPLGKSLSLHTNSVDVDIDGNFKILELPDGFKVFLSRYYPAYIKKPSYAVSDQNFNFNIITQNIDEYIQLFDKKLSGFNNAHISGNLNLKANNLNVNASIPAFSYDGKEFNNIRLNGKGNLDTLVATIDVDDIKISDSLRLPATNLKFSSHNDLSDIHIKTSANQTLGDASINAQVQTLSDGVKIFFAPSSFIINDKKWELEKDGELVFSKSQISASEIKFTQGNQQIKISTTPSAQYSSNDVNIGLTKFDIDDVAQFLPKDVQLEGIVTGDIKITDPFGKQTIQYDTRVDNFRLNGDSIGVVNSKGNYSTSTGIINFKANAENKETAFNIEGSYNTKDSTGNQPDISIVSDRLNLSILNRYLDGIFSNIAGSANTSDLHIKGDKITGTATIKEGSLVVKYTQCKYKFKNETIIFNPDEIDFGNIILKDTLNNTASLSGKMYHRFFTNFGFDNIRFQTDKLLLLNTTKKDNSQFYGKVIGNATMQLNGDIDNMVMNISGEPSRNDSSHIYLLTGNSIESGNIDYIDFIQFGNKMDDNYRGKKSSNFLVNMRLEANEACKIDVILDEATSDIIKGQGTGVLNIKVGNNEPLSINGTYAITKGEYTFNFQTFLKKYFTVSSGTITWNGDPLKANIDIYADYLAKNVDFSNLSNTNNFTNNSKQKGDLNVVSHLTETLLKPKINFAFQLPDASPFKNDFEITKGLSRFKEDENEMNKQVTSLLLFNSFINNERGILNANSGYSVIAGTIGGVVSNALSTSFNKLLQKILNSTYSFDVGLNSNFDLGNAVAKLQVAATPKVTKSFLNGRLVVSVGGSFDYNNPYLLNEGKANNVLITPDFNLEWKITKDGRVRVVAFNRTNSDLTGQRNRTGLSISYRKEIDRLSQLFERDKKK